MLSTPPSPGILRTNNNNITIVYTVWATRLSEKAWSVVQVPHQPTSETLVLVQTSPDPFKRTQDTRNWLTGRWGLSKEAIAVLSVHQQDTAQPVASRTWGGKSHHCGCA
jgi:hypothetical protein